MSNVSCYFKQKKKGMSFINGLLTNRQCFSFTNPKQAVHIIETNLKGCNMNLNEEEKKAVTYLLWNYTTNPDNLIQI